MKLTKNILRENKIINPYELAKVTENKIYIDYSPAENGRMARYAQWEVVGIGFKTDPNGHWLDYGHKTFIVLGREDKQCKLQEAILWANDNFGTTEWEKDPFGSYQIKGTLAKIENIIRSK